MREIFKHIYNSNITRIAENRISFSFNLFDIVLDFSDKIDIDEESLNKFSENEPISELDFSLFSDNSVKCIFLRGYAYIEEYELEVRGHYENETSITYQLFETIRNINKIYPDAIIDYTLGSLYIEDNCWMCPDYGWYYGFEIQIDNKYLYNKDFYDCLINMNLDDSQALSIPQFYNRTKELKDSFDLKILNSNTKIRRLGYLKILLKMMREQSKVPVSKMNKKFEIYCQDYECFLKQHKNQKGDIRITKTGNSANPYIELAGSLGLIRKSAGAYEVGKVGKVYNILIEKIDDSGTNPFVLSRFDTTFFLELLLKEDYWFLYAILEQSAIQPNILYKNLKKDFKQILLGQIKQFMDEAQADNSKKVLPLKIVERRISDWKKPEVYMEHVLMPRLNWLYDMDFIYLKNDLSFQLTEMGNRLLFNLSIWNDISLHKIVSPTAYIDSYFMKIIDFVFNFQKQIYTKEADDEFTKCLEDSFLLFKTLAPNRITFSLFANYTKQMLFWNHSVMVDTEDIKKAFELKRIPNYIYKYQEHYKDGYIQKNK